MARRPEPRILKAANPGPFTLDGTRTHLVGRLEVAVIDPGPDDEDHVRALSRALEGAREIRILLTHAHRDHAGAAVPLAAALGATVLGPPSAAAQACAEESAGEAPAALPIPGFRSLREGDLVPTDQGELVVLETPGHTADHLSFRWPAAKAVFVGDLLLGRGATTWLGEYPGCVGDYLASLRRVRAVRPDVLFPAHGPALLLPEAALDRFDRHRRERLAEVEAARRRSPAATAEEVAFLVYGADLPEGLARAARASVEVMLYHLGEDQLDG